MGTTTRTTLLLLSAPLVGSCASAGPSPQLLDARALCQPGERKLSRACKRRLRRPVHDRARPQSPMAMIPMREAGALGSSPPRP
jgi:hypothetical protein